MGLIPDTLPDMSGLHFDSIIIIILLLSWPRIEIRIKVFVNIYRIIHISRSNALVFETEPDFWAL